MAGEVEVLGGANVPAFRDFVAEGRRIRLPARRCRTGRRLAPDARAADLCTDDEPCAFHSILAMALSHSFDEGRKREGHGISETDRVGTPVPPGANNEAAKLESQPAGDLGLKE